MTFLFDVLHVDGEDLLDTPLEQRSARLGAIAPRLRIPSAITSDRETAQGVLDEALRAGHEGVVVKDAASRYSAGRRGKAWRKMKQDCFAAEPCASGCPGHLACFVLDALADPVFEPFSAPIAATAGARLRTTRR